MPCPAMELGGVGPFVLMIKFESTGKTFCSGAVRGWHVRACGAFGHGMPCPYCRKRQKRKERRRASSKQLRSRCVVALAQASFS